MDLLKSYKACPTPKGHSWADGHWQSPTTVAEQIRDLAKENKFRPGKGKAVVCGVLGAASTDAQKDKFPPNYAANIPSSLICQETKEKPGRHSTGPKKHRDEICLKKCVNAQGKQLKTILKLIMKLQIIYFCGDPYSLHVSRNVLGLTEDANGANGGDCTSWSPFTQDDGYTLPPSNQARPGLRQSCRGMCTGRRESSRNLLATCQLTLIAHGDSTAGGGDWGPLGCGATRDGSLGWGEMGAVGLWGGRKGGGLEGSRGLWVSVFAGLGVNESPAAGA